MVDAYKILKDLLIIKFDELFNEMELHKHDNIEEAQEKVFSLVISKRNKKNEKLKSSTKHKSDDEDSSSKMAHW